jgi:hypothetical protein
MKNDAGTPPKKNGHFVAFYLPQYHSIPENDEWWGPGFTEWVSTAQARPLFSGHTQPNIPERLGFYNLTNIEDQIKQSDLSIKYGIDAFCYWHYWLGNGRRILEKPFEIMLKNDGVKQKFCLGWANHDWKGVFFGAKNKCLLRQEYPGLSDYDAHFYAILPALRDLRYFKLKGKNVFYIYLPKNIPSCIEFIDRWRELAQRHSLPDFYFVGEGINLKDRVDYGLDAVSYTRHRYLEGGGITNKYIAFAYKKLIGEHGLKVHKYKDASKYFLKDGPVKLQEHPSIITGWDTTPRLGRKAFILKNRTPDLFYQHVCDVVKRSEHIPIEENLIFIKSWNEWAEGNYLEPDRKNGIKYLEAFRNAIHVKDSIV